jgi:hypothetical protein
MTDTTAHAPADSGFDFLALLQKGLAAAVAILPAIAPYVKGTGAVGAVIDGIATVLPIIVQVEQKLAPIIAQTIAILRSSSDEITPEQLAALDAFEALIDADFEDAAALALANDAAVAAAQAAKAALPAT